MYNRRAHNKDIRYNSTAYSNVLEETLGYQLLEEWDDDSCVPYYHLIDPYGVNDGGGPYYDINDIIRITEEDVTEVLVASLDNTDDADV